MMNLDELPDRFRIEILSAEHADTVLEFLYEKGYRWNRTTPFTGRYLIEQNAKCITVGLYAPAKITFGSLSNILNIRLNPSIKYINIPLPNNEP